VSYLNYISTSIIRLTEHNQPFSAYWTYKVKYSFKYPRTHYVFRCSH